MPFHFFGKMSLLQTVYFLISNFLYKLTQPTVLWCSGQKSADHDQISGLVYAVIKFSLQNSAPEAQILTKMFNGPNTDKIVADLQRFYRNGCSKFVWILFCYRVKQKTFSGMQTSWPDSYFFLQIKIFLFSILFFAPTNNYF